MRLKSNLFRIGSILLIVMSFVVCLYVLINHNSGNTASQSIKIQEQYSKNQLPNSFGHPDEQQFNNQWQTWSGGSTNGQNSNRDQYVTNGGASRQQMQPMGRKGGNSSSSYGLQVLAYTITFFLAILAIYVLIIRKKLWAKFKIPEHNRKLLVITLFVVGFLLRIALGCLIQGYTSDLMLFKSWASSAANNLSQFYFGGSSSDYPPLYIYVLYMVGKIGSVQMLTPYFTLLLKIPSIAADMGTALLLYRLARKYLSPELSIAAAAFYILNPAVFINSTIWGQVDSFFTLIVVAGIVLLAERKIVFSSMLFTAAVLMKPQGIIFLPVLFFELVRRKSIKVFLKVLLASMATSLVIILPCSSNLNFLWIVKLYMNTLGEYPYASVNAFNFFILVGANYTKDASTLLLVSYHTWGMVFIVLSTLISWLMYARGKGKGIAAVSALILISGVFIFSARMHERYLFPAAALATLASIYLRDRRLILLAVGFSMTSFANTFAILYQNVTAGSQAISAYLPNVISAFNILLFLCLIKVTYDNSSKNDPSLFVS